MIYRSPSREVVEPAAAAARSPRRPARLLALLPALALLAGAAAGAQEPALRIDNKSFDPASGTVSYELANETARVITAWRLSLAAGDSLGRPHRSQMDQDFYVGLDPSTPLERILEPRVRQGPLHPGQRLTATWQIDLAAGGGGPVALSIRPVAWIFADASHGGSDDAAAALLSARAARLDQIATLLADLRRASLGRRPTSDRRARAERLATELRQRADAAAVAEDLPAGTAAVVAATCADLAEWLESTEQQAAAEPLGAAEVYRAFESELGRELRIGRTQLAPTVEP